MFVSKNSYFSEKLPILLLSFFFPARRDWVTIWKTRKENPWEQWAPGAQATEFFQEAVQNSQIRFLMKILRNLNFSNFFGKDQNRLDSQISWDFAIEIVDFKFQKIVFEQL